MQALRYVLLVKLKALDPSTLMKLTILIGITQRMDHNFTSTFWTIDFLDTFWTPVHL